MCCEKGKRVRIIFEDLGNSRSKIGTIISKDAEFVEIETDNRIELIPIIKIIRIEVLER